MTWPAPINALPSASATTVFFNMIMLCAAVVLTYASAYFFLMKDSTEQLDEDKKTTMQSLLKTFLASVYFGTRTVGGLGVYLGNWEVGNKNYIGQFFIDLFFFLIFNVVCLSFLCGLVMESYFIFKRHLLQEQLERNKEYCFVCHQSILQLKNSGEDWNAHLDERHSLLSYFHFFIYLHLNQDLYQFGNSKVIKEMEE